MTRCSIDCPTAIEVVSATPVTVENPAIISAVNCTPCTLADPIPIGVPSIPSKVESGV